jgi:hypothetical protein
MRCGEWRGGCDAIRIERAMQLQAFGVKATVTGECALRFSAVGGGLMEKIRASMRGAMRAAARRSKAWQRMQEH